MTSRATDDYRYELPPAAIAQAAIEPRDAARLLLASTLEDRHVSDLPEVLRPGDLLVVNRTRVRAARLEGTKAETGGKVELLLIRRRDAEHWEALIRPARRIRPGTTLHLGPMTGRVVEGPARGMVIVTIDGDGDIEDLVARTGTVPLPPYFHGRLADPERYQTLFATSIGSAAAPTAGLHFTDDLLARLDARGISRTEVELDVGLDTFRPIATAQIDDHEMHHEAYRVPDEAAESVAAARRDGRRVVAVGTTVVRTL
ncbi:MAG: S-adenosylmethionine:tRNA ribosyltransferase-isomerase, partial [Acidimicrobiia bacterium]